MEYPKLVVALPKRRDTLLQHINSAHNLKITNSKLYEFDVVEKRKQSSINFPVTFFKKTIQEKDISVYPSTSSTANDNVECDH